MYTLTRHLSCTGEEAEGGRGRGEEVGSPPKRKCMLTGMSITTLASFPGPKKAGALE